MNSRWRAVVARGAGLTVCAPAGEAECEGCGPVPTARAAGVAGAGGRAGPLRTGTTTVATSCCNVAFQQWVPTIKATIAERGRSGCYAIARGRVTQRTCPAFARRGCCLYFLHEILTEPTRATISHLHVRWPETDRLASRGRECASQRGWYQPSRPAGARVHHRRQPTLTRGAPPSATMC